MEVKTVDLQQIIEAYYESVKQDFPKVTKSQFEVACWAAHNFIADMMEDDNLPTIEVVYFGTFAVYDGKLENILDKLKRDKNAGRITEMEFMVKWGEYINLLTKLKENPPGTSEYTNDIVKYNKDLNKQRKKKYQMSTSVVTLLDEEDNVLYKTPE